MTTLDNVILASVTVFDSNRTYQQAESPDKSKTLPRIETKTLAK